MIGCTNENEEIIDLSEWRNLLIKLDESQSATYIEDFFDVDIFLTEMVVEYLTSSYNCILYSIGHNYYMYKLPNGKMTIFILQLWSWFWCKS